MILDIDRSVTQRITASRIERLHVRRSTVKMSCWCDGVYTVRTDLFIMIRFTSCAAKVTCSSS